MTKKQKLGIKLCKQDFIPSRAVLGEILKIGIPVAIQDGCIQIAFIIITVIANSRGLNDAAAVGIVEKVISALFIVPSSMLATVSALAAQNIGAGKHDRASKTLKYAILITFTYGIIVAIIGELITAGIVGIFTKDAAVVVLGSQYLRGYIVDCALAGIHFCFSGYFCAIRQILHRIHPQYDCDHLSACTGFVSGLEVLRRYPVPDGTCSPCRIHAFGYYLCMRIYMDEKTRAPWSQSDTRCSLVHIQSRRDKLRFD